jgi:hypothetical protein
MARTSRYMFGGHFAEAVKYAEQAINIDPQAPWLRGWIGRRVSGNEDLSGQSNPSN